MSHTVYSRVRNGLNRNVLFVLGDKSLALKQAPKIPWEFFHGSWCCYIEDIDQCLDIVVSSSTFRIYQRNNVPSGQHSVQKYISAPILQVVFLVMLLVWVVILIYILNCFSGGNSMNMTL